MLDCVSSLTFTLDLSSAILRETLPRVLSQTRRYSHLANDREHCNLRDRSMQGMGVSRCYGATEHVFVGLCGACVCVCTLCVYVRMETFLGFLTSVFQLNVLLNLN